MWIRKFCVKSTKLIKAYLDFQQSPEEPLWVTHWDLRNTVVCQNLYQLISIRKEYINKIFFPAWQDTLKMWWKQFPFAFHTVEDRAEAVED